MEGGLYLLESSLAVLALISDPSLIAHARPVDTFPGRTALVARFGRRGVRGEDQVEQHVQQQVSVQTSQLAAASAYFWSKDWQFDVASPPRIHFAPFLFKLSFFAWFLTSRSSKPIDAPGPLGVWFGGRWEASASYDALVALKRIRDIPRLLSILENGKQCGE